MDYRLIIITNESGSEEIVIFLDVENEVPFVHAADFCRPHQTVEFDGKITIEGELPSGFPLNHNLVRE